MISFMLLVAEGEEVKLELQASGYPRPKVTWYKDGKEIVPDKKFKVKREGDKYSLVIPKASLDAAGKYKAKVKNPLGEEECDAEVVVNAKRK